MKIDLRVDFRGLFDQSSRERSVFVKIIHFLVTLKMQRVKLFIRYCLNIAIY